jgi:hypothetical protein
MSGLQHTRCGVRGAERWVVWHHAGCKDLFQLLVICCTLCFISKPGHRRSQGRHGSQGMGKHFGIRWQAEGWNV